MNKARKRWVLAGWWLSDEEVAKLKDALSNAIRDLHAHEKRLDLLRTRLRQAAEVVSAPAGEGSEAGPWRARAVLQIKANLDFLYGEGIEPDLLEPIRQVMPAFADLKRGASSRHLIPHRSEDEQGKRRPGAPTSRLTDIENWKDQSSIVLGQEYERHGDRLLMPSIIGKDLVVRGCLASQGDIQIDCAIEGDVRGVTIRIGDGGSVSGTIVGDSVLITGTVSGRIRSKAVVLARTARVQADLWVDTLTIEAGARFEGACKRFDSEAEGELQQTDMAEAVQLR